MVSDYFMALVEAAQFLRALEINDSEYTNPNLSSVTPVDLMVW